MADIFDAEAAKKPSGFSRSFLRVAAFAAAVLTAASALTGCGGEKAGQQEETSDVALADDYLDSALPTDTYDGATFGIIGSGHTQVDPGDEENSEPVHDAQLRRNLKIAERYDVNFEYNMTEGYDYVNQAVEAATLANEQLYNLAFGVYAGCGTYFVNNGLIMSTDNIPHLDLTQKWWSQDCTDQLTIGDKTLFLTGMINYEHCVDGTCIFFNKKITEDKALDNHFDDVRAYRWTLDKMYANAKIAAHDDNGDTQMDASDTWGFVFHANTGYGLMASCNIHPLEFDEEHIPSVIQTPGQEIFEKVDKISSILTNRRYCACYHLEEFAEIKASFTKGKALYTQGLCQDGAGTYRPADFYDFGILPDPLWEEGEQDYHSFGHTWDGGGIYFPIICPDEEMTGVITEALAYQSSVDGGYYYAIIEKYIKGKGTYDYDSEEMVDLVLSGKVYDLSNLFDFGISGVINTCCVGVEGGKIVDGNLSSLWAGKANASKSQCRQTVRTWERLD